MRKETSQNLGDADGILLVGASERNADLYYATGFLAPDPFVFVATAKKSLMLVNDMELDRAKAQATVDSVHSRFRFAEQMRRDRGEEPGSNAVLLALLREMGLQHVRVPRDFPLGVADALRAEGIRLEVADSSLFPQRALKTDIELDFICEAIKTAESGMQTAIDMISSADIRNRQLYIDDELLTSERVRQAVHHTLLDQDYVAERTIIACGDAACDPHQVGSGAINAGEAIVIDIFPRSAAHGYFGDITRTVTKGAASPELQKLYYTVQQAQDLVLGAIRTGADGAELHRAVLAFFADNGYETGVHSGRNQGFFHGTGHGLGLEIHEAPSIGSSGNILQATQVVTVEPGLYYTGLGGVRIEDVVVVRDDGCENLTRFPKVLEL